MPRRDFSADLDRIERKLDRLTRLVTAVLLCQPVLLVGALMPDVTTQLVLYVLLALLAVLALFPNLEKRLPPLMRRLGRGFGRVRRWVRAVVPSERPAGVGGRSSR